MRRIGTLPLPPPRSVETRPRRSLFVKYFVTLFVAVVTPLLIGAASDGWFGYRDQRAILGKLLQVEAQSGADRIQTFIDGITAQLGWAVQLPWIKGEDERHRIDASRLLRQVPAISSITLVDDAGIERIFVSRRDLNRIGSGTDMSATPEVTGARLSKTWFGPVRYERDSEPYMTIAIAGNRLSSGVAIADINLKLIRDVIASIKIGVTGHAFVIDDSGRLVAHPDISLVLRGSGASNGFSRLESAVVAAKSGSVVTADSDGTAVIATSTRAYGLGWTIIVQQPVREAFASIRAALWRALILIVSGTLFALLLAWWLAHRISGPIHQLEDGARRFGAGQFGHRIAIKTGDELEQLAGRFNRMAAELAISKEKTERINRLKRFLAPQVAELAENSETQGLLRGQRRDVVVIFGDLRGFTAFSATAEPNMIMNVLSDYHEALGTVITRHQATLTGFAGDGLMVLLNAPVECDQPALRAMRLAIDMQAAVQTLIIRWQAGGHAIGFGIGMAMGLATVGTVGYEGRIDYTAIGSVVNLASRLCGQAVNSQILLDSALAGAVAATIAVDRIGERPIRGYAEPQPIFAISQPAAGWPS